MTRHCCFWALVPVGMLTLVLGCGRAPEPETVPAAAPSTHGLRLHWVGKAGVLADTNTTLSQVWHTEASQRLESEVTEKLGRHWAVAAGLPTNSENVTLLASFLSDALARESWLEWSPSTNAATLTLAVKVDDERARQWETQWRQLGAEPASSGSLSPAWLRKSAGSRVWAWARLRDWSILVGQAQGDSLPAPEVTLTRLQRPFPELPERATNAWLELTTDGGAFAGTNFPPATITLAVAPEGADLRTRGIIEFARPVPLNLPAWDVPTNVIRGPLSSFTAVRGISNALAAWPAWAAFKAGPPPAQLSSWSVSSALVESHLAFPDAQAARRVQSISTTLIDRSGDWFGGSGMGGFRAGSDGTGAVWSGLPFVIPSVRVATNDSATYVLASLAPVREDTNDFPAALSDYLQEHPRLVYYDWQLTGPQVQAGILGGQLTRLLFQRSQLPGDSASLLWLQSLVRELGNCVTVVEADSGQRWTFSRRAGIGLTALELHLLADWFAAPGFPEKLRFMESFEPPPVLVPEN